MSLLLLLNPKFEAPKRLGVGQVVTKKEKKKNIILKQIEVEKTNTVENVKAVQFLKTNKNLAKSKKLIEDLDNFLNQEEQKQQLIFQLAEKLKKQEWNNKTLQILKDKQDLENKIIKISLKLKEQTEEEELLFLILVEES